MVLFGVEGGFINLKVFHAVHGFELLLAKISRLLQADCSLQGLQVAISLFGTFNQPDSWLSYKLQHYLLWINVKSIYGVIIG